MSARCIRRQSKLSALSAIDGDIRVAIFAPGCCQARARRSANLPSRSLPRSPTDLCLYDNFMPYQRYHNCHLKFFARFLFCALCCLGLVCVLHKNSAYLAPVSVCVCVYKTIYLAITIIAEEDIRDKKRRHTGCELTF